MTTTSNNEKARKQVLRWLRHGELTRARAGERLLEKGFDAKVTDGVIDELAAEGILDDARCAESLVNAWCRSGPIAAAELERRLLERGVDAQLAASICMEACSEDQLDDAIAAAKARLGRLGDLPGDVLARRLYQHLARRGFDEDTACRTLDALGLSPVD